MDVGRSSFAFAVSVSLIVGGLVFLYMVLRRLNEWFYEGKLGEKRAMLPPGDMGWPLIGNMMAFLSAFKSSDPDSFIAGFVKRYSNTGIYKAFMFGSPTILVTTSDICKQVLMDETGFMPGWPSSTCELTGYKSFIAIPYEEHKWLRKITAAPVNGHEALSVYLSFIEEAVIKALDKWSTMGEIEFLTQVRKLTFRIITYIFLSSEGDPIMEALEREYTALNYGVRAMAINLPGFSYYKALKARKKLVAILQGVLDKRRENRSTSESPKKKDMMDALLQVEDDVGRKLLDEQIIDTLIMYLNAGHESSGHVTMWAIAFLEKKPLCL